MVTKIGEKTKGGCGGDAWNIRNCQFVVLHGNGGIIPESSNEQILDISPVYLTRGISFWGGFLYKISISEKQPDELTIKELAEYARFGNAVANLCVERKGAIPAMPELHQVEKRVML